MVAKKGRRKIETKTVLYILIIVIIIGGIYIFISSQPPKTDYRDPEDVLANKDDIISRNQTIIIRGYYDADVVEGGGIVSISYAHSGAEDPTHGLPLDTTKVDNLSKLRENEVLLFTGKLVYDESDPFGNSVIFEATKIDDK